MRLESYFSFSVVNDASRTVRSTPSFRLLTDLVSPPRPGLLGIPDTLPGRQRWRQLLLLRQTDDLIALLRRRKLVIQNRPWLEAQYLGSRRGQL